MTKDKAVEKEIERRFEDDLKKKLNPLYDIEQSVHKDTLQELKELFVASGLSTAKAKEEEGKVLAEVILNKIKEVSELKEQIKQLQENKKLLIHNFDDWLFVNNINKKEIKQLQKENEKLEEEIHIRNGEVKINGKWIKNK